MDTTPAPSALDALRTAEFRLSLRGYDVDEVDDFLERAAVEADQLREQVRLAVAQVSAANERVRQLEAERGAPVAAPQAPEPAPVAPEPAPVTAAVAAPSGPGAADTVAKMIEMAERFVDQTRRDAEAEAATVVAAAQDRARQLASDAQQRLADEVARLEGLRHRLGEDVEKMARQLESERTRLSGSLQELLSWIDKNIQPGAALAALRSTPMATSAAPQPSADADGGTDGAEGPADAEVFRLDDARRDD